MSDDTLTVTVVEHPKGALMRIEFYGMALSLDRDEALDLLEKMNAKLGEMPVKI